MGAGRDRSYSQFNFRVEIENGPNADSTRAGFQEVSGLGMEITFAEYRDGNEMDNAPRKVTGTFEMTNVTLKRGVIAELETINQWLDEARSGSQNALRTVIVQLQSKDHAAEPVQEWELQNARPIKFTGPAFAGKSTDVAIEELVLACERIDLR